MLLSLLNLYLHIHLEFWNHMVSCPFPFLKKKKIYLFNLAVLGLGGSVARGIRVPQPGTESKSCALQDTVSTLGPPGKSLPQCF